MVLTVMGATGLAHADTHCDATDPLEVWCATLTVGSGTVSGDTAYGYGRTSPAFGSATPDTFTWRSLVAGPNFLYYADTSLLFGVTANTTPVDGILGPGNFSLEIGTGADKKSLAIDNPGTNHIFSFTNPSLSWTVGDTIAVKLLRVPVPPMVANNIPNQTATAGNAFSYAFPANTFSGAGAGYTANKADGSALPAWLSFDANSRTFSGTPTSADIGTLSVTVTATDAGVSASDTFSIVVEGKIAGQTANIAEPFSYTVPTSIFASASTTGTLTYSARLANGRALGSNTQLAHGRVKPGWLRFNGSSRTFWGTPLPGTNGTTSVQVTATDERRREFHARLDITVGVDFGLASNFTRPATTGRNLEWFNHAQKFTTGAETTGYTVTSIDVLLYGVGSTSNFPTIAITSGALPGTNVGTLQAPGSGASGGDKAYRYTAPANLALSANTSYWIVITGESSRRRSCEWRGGRAFPRAAQPDGAWSRDPGGSVFTMIKGECLSERGHRVRTQPRHRSGSTV